MFCKVYNLEFSSIKEAKIGVSYLSEEIGGAIAEWNIASLSILLDKRGAVSISVRFDNLEEMEAFAKNNKQIFVDLKESFSLRFKEISAVAVYSFEREATNIA